MCPDNKNCAGCNGAPTSPERRKFLGWLIGLFNAAVGIAVIGPVIGFVAAPLATKLKGKWVAVIDEKELKVGGTMDVSYALTVKDGYRTVNRRYNIFLRRYEDRVAAFDPACTHLGCRVEYQQDKRRYFCPCHGGVFNEDGEVVSGPPPKPLEQHPAKVEDGQIWIYREV